MIEYNYLECTTAVLLGLTTFRKFYPDYSEEEIAYVNPHPSLISLPLGF